MSSLFGTNKNNEVDSTARNTTATTTTHHDRNLVHDRADRNLVHDRAPIVNEQHVYTQSSAAPEIREKHVVREQHVTQEVPIIEKKVVHERPVIQEKTIVHEKPIVHEKKVVTNEREVVKEQPLVQRQTDQIVREAPTVVHDTTSSTHHGTTHHGTTHHATTTTTDNESKPGFFGKLFGAGKHDEKHAENAVRQEEHHVKDAAATSTAATGTGGMLKNLFSSNVPRPFATTTYDYGTAGSTTVAQSVPASDLNTTATLPNGPIDNAAMHHNNNKISSA